MFGGVKSTWISDADPQATRPREGTPGSEFGPSLCCPHYSPLTLPHPVPKMLSSAKGQLEPAVERVCDLSPVTLYLLGDIVLVLLFFSPQPQKFLEAFGHGRS